MIKGLIAPILSPFNDDLSFNQDMYNALAAELLQTGCSGLAPFGTTGEALSIGSAERMAAIEGLIASGVDPKRVIPGTGLCNLPETIALSRHAVELGCAGVMTLPPFYFKGMGDDGYFDYFERLIDGVDHPDLKIYLYHIPQVSGVGLSIELVTRLRAAYPDVIVGITTHRMNARAHSFGDATDRPTDRPRGGGGLVGESCLVVRPCVPHRWVVSRGDVVSLIGGS